MNEYKTYTNCTVYDFNVEYGGIGDCLKFFMILLDRCIENKERIYWKINNTLLEKYLKLKYEDMYITNDEIPALKHYNIVKPFGLYYISEHPFTVQVSELFYFTNDILTNSIKLFPQIQELSEYYTIHVRLGDKYLETDKAFVACPNDTRVLNEDKMFKFIEENSDKMLLLCCDNNQYKQKIAQMYKNVIITNCNIGHTSLTNTTEEQVLDSITEFYLLAKSNKIYSGSRSGFSLVASKFYGTEFIQ